MQVEAEVKSLKVNVTILKNEISGMKIAMESTKSILNHNKNTQYIEQNNQTI